MRLRKRAEGPNFTLAELEDILKQARSADLARIDVPLPGAVLAKLVAQTVRAERDFRDVRAACRREIMQIETKHLEQMKSVQEEDNLRE